MNAPSIPPRRFLLFLIAAFLLAFALLFASVGRSIVRTEAQYERDGVTAKGIVTAKYTEERRDSENRNRTDTYYYVRYRFTSDTGAIHESSGSVDSATYQQMSPDSPVDIQYLRSDPGSSRVAQVPDYTMGYIFMGIGFVIGLASMGTAAYEIRQRLLAGRLSRDGILCEGCVVAAGPGNFSVNDITYWRVTYSFRNNRGEEILGTTPHMHPDIAAQWEIGHTGKVRYDRNNSALNMWVG